MLYAVSLGFHWDKTQGVGVGVRGWSTISRQPISLTLPRPSLDVGPRFFIFRITVDLDDLSAIAFSHEAGASIPLDGQV